MCALAKPTSKAGAKARDPKSAKPDLSLVQASPEKAAELAGLNYVTDEDSGITRRKCGRGFQYLDPDGKPIRDKKTVQRAKSLGIPPAYHDVWICTDPKGHLQATACADNGKKQYIYHPDWRNIRNTTKYHQMILFGEALPALRQRVEKDLRHHGLPRAKVLAAVVQLLDRTLIRIGNDRYARENKSYGLTTIRKKHVEVHGNDIHFEFSGKGGVEWDIDIEDSRLARIVKKCEELPGHELFKYLDETGKRHDVGSKDVNEYLHEITGEEFTAKFFRTWAGTVCAYQALMSSEPIDQCTQAAAKKHMSAAIKQVAAELSNTPAVCKKNYIHPEILEAYLDGTLHNASFKSAAIAGLDEAEAATLAFLKCREQSQC